ncbi:hypothetical protein MUO74_03430 [Candidatus Bathyarchaeota archaeon]|jgi:hypothetical protein|nr:hypothetical protein [Candidatus Bathyarchaeota archaeon]
MKKLNALPLIFVVLFSIFAMLPIAASIAESRVQEAVIIIYAIPPKDNSMTNPNYELIGIKWYTTINYYINPSNSYGFSTTAAVNTITASTSAWDKETAFAVFSYKGTTTKTAGKRDGYNVISWGRYSVGAIAVTYLWYSGDRITETDCRMNTRYAWSLTGEAGKMDVQNIMTHEFGHWCGLADLYNAADYWLTMYGYGNYGETYKRTLGLGDINGLEAVYGP